VTNPKRHTRSALALGLVVAIFLAPLPGRAQPAAGPAAALQKLVSGFYTPYIHTPSGQEPPDAAGIIAAHATPALVRLLRNDQACQTRSQGVCNLDFDVIISGQDWDLTAPPRVTVRQASGGKIIIASQFTNDGTASEVDYIFLNTSGKWLIDDMTSPTPAADSWRLTKILANEPG